MHLRLYISAVLLLIGVSTLAQGGYPGKGSAADTPQIFAEGILSDGLNNRDFAISPEGDEVFFTIQGPRFALSTILRITKRNGQWGEPEVAPFSGKWRDLEAAFSPDGQFIYFSSDRPVNGEAKKDFDLWRVKRLPGGRFGKPENLGTVVNSDKNEFYPSVARSGNLYFTVEADYGKGSEDIVICKWNGTGFAKPESLPEDINTKCDEFNAFVDPDERFIFFSSYGRPDDMGGGDLYFSRKNENGDWLPVKHLPAPFNSKYLDYCPYITPDKKYMIFTSNRMSPRFKDDRTKSYRETKTLLSEPGNGNDDIYWVKFNRNWLK